MNSPCNRKSKCDNPPPTAGASELYPNSMGKPEMNRSAKGGVRSSLRFGDEGVLIHPPHQGDCGRHGTEGQRVTSGELAESPGGTGVSRPISESEMASNALSVVGRLRITYEAW